MTLQRAGGISAIIASLSIVFVIAVLLLVIAPAMQGEQPITATVRLAFLSANLPLMTAVNLVGFVLFGAVMAVLALALDERLRVDAPGLSRVALTFGVIWSGLVFAAGMIGNIGADLLVRLSATDLAQAEAALPAYLFVVDGLGGGNEIVGGLWLGLVGLAASKGQGWPRLANWLAIVVGLAGVATTFPPFKDLAMVFGVGLVVWYAWVGVILLRQR